MGLIGFTFTGAVSDEACNDNEGVDSLELDSAMSASAPADEASDCTPSVFCSTQKSSRHIGQEEEAKAAESPALSDSTSLIKACNLLFPVWRLLIVSFSFLESARLTNITTPAIAANENKTIAGLPSSSSSRYLKPPDPEERLDFPFNTRSISNTALLTASSYFPLLMCGFM